jgi:Methyltransferase domain
LNVASGSAAETVFRSFSPDGDEKALYARAPVDCSRPELLFSWLAFSTDPNLILSRTSTQMSSGDSVKKMIAELLPPKARGFYRLRRSALDEWGWFNSIKKGFPCDEAGQPIPWISYAAVALLRSRVKGDWDIFEFGSGYSTLWWAKHCRSVTSSEHDAAWYDEIAKLLPENCTLLSTELGVEYPMAAKRTKKRFDVIVIDGRKRVRCALNSVECLKEEGVIVWDDTDREYYQEGLAKLVTLGFKRIDLVGMTPMLSTAKQTSILYRSPNVLDI